MAVGPKDCSGDDLKPAMVNNDDDGSLDCTIRTILPPLAATRTFMALGKCFASLETVPSQRLMTRSSNGMRSIRLENILYRIGWLEARLAIYGNDERGDITA